MLVDEIPLSGVTTTYTIPVEKVTAYVNTDTDAVDGEVPREPGSLKQGRQFES